MAEYIEYELLFGTFEGENFKWKTLKKFNNFKEAYREYKKFVDKQMSYSVEELLKIWSSGRIDIELRQGTKLLNWVGVYCRRTDPDKKMEKSKEKDSDSLTLEKIFERENIEMNDIIPYMRGFQGNSYLVSPKEKSSAKALQQVLDKYKTEGRSYFVKPFRNLDNLRDVGALVEPVYVVSVTERIDL